MSVDALAEGAGSPTVTAPGREPPTDEPAAVGHADVDAGAETGDSLFDPETTVRVVAMQHLVPVLATVGSYLTFRAVVFV